MAARRISGSGRGIRGDDATAMPAKRRSAKRPPAKRDPASARELRIIGGRWRGRRWQFPAAAVIRPTADRVRETLFNWLMDEIAGARCLDAFAGSGALGLEALSRGAAEVTFIENDRVAAAAIRDRLQEWSARGASVLADNALRWLKHGPVTYYDIVFLDPPFSAGLLPHALDTLLARRWLSESALVYVESPPGMLEMPARWVLHRSGRAGAVGYHLLRPMGAA